MSEMPEAVNYQEMVAEKLKPGAKIKLMPLPLLAAPLHGAMVQSQPVELLSFGREGLFTKTGRGTQFLPWTSIGLIEFPDEDEEERGPSRLVVAGRMPAVAN